MRFAEVAVDAPAGYARTFSYSIPPSLSVRPGQLVRVPLGSRTLQGMVFSLEAAPRVPQTRDILEVTGPEPLLTETRLGLARWISGYYMCSLLDAAALMLPPGGRSRVKTILSLGDVPAATGELSLTPLQQRVMTYVRNRGKVDESRVIKTLGETARRSIGSLVSKGVLARSNQPGSTVVRPKYRKQLRLVGGGRQAMERWLAEERRHAPRQTALAQRLLSEDSPLWLTQASKEYGASAINSLVSKGWIEKASVPMERDPLAGRWTKDFRGAPPSTLTPRQNEVASEIRAALRDPAAIQRAFLIQGVTGSGKTEIYLDAAAQCLELGKKAIVMVPEIALTHQTIERFSARFPGRIAVLHSGLTPGERFDQWWGIKRGEYDVVIGSRGAIFAPQPDLGLIVIDEEHEWTYKQNDPSPRYHAGSVASRLAQMSGAVVVAGSASPDVGSYYRGLRKRIRLLLLPERVHVNGSAPLPLPAPLARVDVVDMKRELREGNRRIFSRRLMSAMEECLDGGDQMILFLNRRGSSSYRQCRSCGYSLRCRRCDVALTHHRQVDRLICHYCGYKRLAPTKCPRCLGYRMAPYGFGVQTVEEEVSRMFPKANVVRWDSDAVSGARAHERLSERFRSGEANVLVGTQMIAKGLHFPSVTLVGVVSADVGLNIPDYRAGERAFQLLCQVAGRAGRGTAGGSVIVQTYQPDNYAVAAAASQDYQRFYGKEMSYRREHANPPYSKLIRLLYTHLNQALCEREANRFARVLREQREVWGYSDVELLGPTPAYPARLKGRYRWHIVLRGPEPRKLLDTVSVPNAWIVDIDPVSLT